MTENENIVPFGLDALSLSRRAAHKKPPLVTTIAAQGMAAEIAAPQSGQPAARTSVFMQLCDGWGDLGKIAANSVLDSLSLMAEATFVLSPEMIRNAQRAMFLPAAIIAGASISRSPAKALDEPIASVAAVISAAGEPPRNVVAFVLPPGPRPDLGC